MQLFNGDCRDVVKTLPDCSVDSVVTDPPYSLVSIQKRFGKAGAAPAKDRDGLYQRASRGFMGKTWDTGETAFDPAFWAEVLRVLKPGGHLLAFGGTRTYHRLVCAIEDAGFEIRDAISWHYGQGFPKSLDVGKAIDKAAGAQREIVRERYTVKRIKPGATVEREGAWGKQDLAYTATDTAPTTDAAKQWHGWGTALKPATELIVLARKPLEGTVIENVQEHGTGGLNIEACRVPLADGDWLQDGVAHDGRALDDTKAWGFKAVDRAPGLGRWPANVIHDGSEEVLAGFPDAPGQQRSVGPEHGLKNSVNVYGDYGARETFNPRNDSGSAARFFYCAKADKKDRRGSKHPTVKPIALLRYLCRLITPPGGTILDPFAGSGTTGEAAIEEGFHPILIEREAEYFADIQRRMHDVVFAA